MDEEEYVPDLVSIQVSIGKTRFTIEPGGFHTGWDDWSKGMVRAALLQAAKELED